MYSLREKKAIKRYMEQRGNALAALSIQNKGPIPCKQPVSSPHFVAYRHWTEAHATDIRVS